MLREMINYTRVADELMIQTMLANKPVPVKAISLFSHVLTAQHIWIQRICDQKPSYAVWEEHLLEDFYTISAANFEQLKDILDKIDLDKVITYAKSNGETFANSVKDILFHVVNHSTYHRAQIASLLKAHTIQPPITDYIILKREMQL
jgi:uncharacterized damage-inducible protein DinB